MVLAGTSVERSETFSAVKTNTAMIATMKGKLSVKLAPSLVLNTLLAWVSSTVWSDENNRSNFFKLSGHKRCVHTIRNAMAAKEAYTMTETMLKVGLAGMTRFNRPGVLLNDGVTSGKFLPRTVQPGHGSHWFCPSSACHRPAGHSRQRVPPFPRYPDGQFSQTPALFGRLAPSQTTGSVTHCVTLLDPIPSVVLGFLSTERPQSLHAKEPGISVYFPRSHCLQDCDSVESWNVPAVQRTGLTMAIVAQAWPFGHL